MDGRRFNGGAREGAGRKPKTDEQDLIDKLRPMDELALNMIRTGLQNNDPAILKIFMGYRFGQPKQTIDANVFDATINWTEEKMYASNN